MNQQKIGKLLKELRKQKALTQEQFAEIFNVSNRTVSRWENGKNMPDLDILIEISDYYEIDLRELLDGERRNECMNKELEETVLKAVDYTNTETKQYIKRVNLLLLEAVICYVISQIISYTGLAENAVASAVSDVAEGMASGMLIFGVFITSSLGLRIKAFKQRLLKKE